MKIILIDDEPLILEELSYLCEKHKDIEICGKFVNPKQALQYVAGHHLMPISWMPAIIC